MPEMEAVHPQVLPTRGARLPRRGGDYRNCFHNRGRKIALGSPFRFREGVTESGNDASRFGASGSGRLVHLAWAKSRPRPVLLAPIRKKSL